VLLDYVANQIDNEKSHSTQHIYNPHQEIIITGGIGDFIALESHFPEHWRKNIKKIYLATRASTAIKQIISYLPQYKHAKIESLWNNFTNFFAFYNKKEVQNKLPKNNIKWRKIKDWSISLKFPAIHYGYYRYHDSLLSKVSLANLSKFKLPARYATIVFVSENDRRLKNREFSPKDFANLLAFLEKINLQGVIVNRSKIKPPKHKLLIDLSNKTTILESLEIVKQSTCYIGIDSCLAVFAARHLPPERVVIKCINKHAIEHRNIYFRNVELVKRITAKRLKSLDNTLLHHERNTTIKKDSDRKNYDGETTARM
jgi:hypothetical protein